MFYHFYASLTPTNSSNKSSKTLKSKLSARKQQSHDPTNMADFSLQASGPQPGGEAPSSLFIEFSGDV